jgi:hypothetical protein
MAKVLIDGQTTECILDNLIITKCMEKESSLGLMVDHMRASTIKTKSKVKEYTLGLTDADTMESG